MSPAPTEVLAPPPTRGQLFVGFFLVGISGFGGVMPHSRRVLVDQHRWITDRQFTELLSLGQTLPGPNAVNMAAILGDRFQGWPGAVLSVFALVSAPLAVVLLLAQAYAHLAHSAPLARALTGVAAAAAGLILATGGRLALRMDREVWSWTLLVLTFLAVFVGRLPLLWVLLGLGPVGVGLGWHSVRREDRAARPEAAP